MVIAFSTLVACLTAWPAVARAYTIANIFDDGCHEKLTADALRAVRLEFATAAPLVASEDDQALIADLEFSLPADLADVGAATLLLGVRDNDLKGRQSNDVTELALVHGDPNLQREHCLRSANDDEPGGSHAAIAACRDFIRQRVGEALAGLDATGTPDAANRTSLPVYLAFRRRVDASLPTFYLRLGQAVHALQDSFTHTYRTSAGTEVTTVVNWVDKVDEANGTLVEATDGPPHAGELDRCDDPDDLRRQRRLLAADATLAVLRTALDPDAANDQKLAALTVILDRYLGYAPGCSFDNGWCHAPEQRYGGRSGLACDVSGSDDGAWASVSAILTVWLVAACRTRRRGGRAAMLAIAVWLTASLAASDAAAELQPASTDVSGATTTKAPPGPSGRAAEPASIAWGGHASGSGSIDYGGLATTVGARLRVSKHWTFGIDAEWNPWFAVNGASRIRAGALNGYATTILRIPLAYERFDLRTTFNLGFSTLLIDLYGAPKGSTGIFVGFCPLGLEWQVSRRTFVILDPLGYALPVPQLRDLPFAFPQYRTTVGIEIYGG